MYLVRSVFTARPGKAKELVAKFKAAQPHIEEAGVARNSRVLTDAVAGFWTVVVESEVDDLEAYFEMARNVSADPELGRIMAGYMDCVDSGYREVLRIE